MTTRIFNLTMILESINRAGRLSLATLDSPTIKTVTNCSITMEKLDMAMKTNVHGLLAVAQNVGPKMEKRGEGVIVVTGATASLRGSWG